MFYVRWTFTKYIIFISRKIFKQLQIFHNNPIFLLTHNKVYIKVF
ncbi:MAG: hypothetical protein ACKPKO_14785 [Candidatus Fonsibacter sp.]